MIDEENFDIYDIDLELDEFFIDEDYNIVLDAREKLLKDNGIVLLEPMEKIRRRKINNIVLEFDDISSFSIGCDNERRVMIRRIKKEYVNHKRLIKEMEKEYERKNYKKFIEKSLLYLNTSKYTVSSTYKKIGVAFFRLREIDKAIDFLTAAKLMNKKYLLDGVIDNLKNNIIQYSVYDMKSNPQFCEEEFEYLDYDSEFEMFNNYVISNNMTIEDTCKKLDLSEEEKYIIILKYAKYYYMLGEDEKGDIFFKEAIKMKDKSKTIKDIIDEIDKNRKFYKYRNDSYTKKLTYPKLK